MRKGPAAMNYEEWEKAVPGTIAQDVLWRVKAYRLALFLCDVCWHDAGKLLKDQRSRSLSNQLYRAIGSIAANIAEGYSRGSGRDRVRFYEYSLGSAREARTWYYAGRHVLGHDVVEHRCSLLVEIIRLLLTMIADQRPKNLREEPVEYGTESNNEDIPP